MEQPKKKKSFLRRLSFSSKGVTPPPSQPPPLPIEKLAPVVRPTDLLQQQQYPYSPPSGEMASLKVSPRPPIHPALASPPQTSRRRLSDTSYGFNNPPRSSSRRSVSAASPSSPALNRFDAPPLPLPVPPTMHPYIRSDSAPVNGSPPFVQSAVQGSPNGPNGISEASAYAKAHRSPTRTQVPLVTPGVERRISRPLPRPPSVIKTAISPPTSPISRSAHSPLVRRRPRKLTLHFILSHTRIQSALLPYLTINSFLSLAGSSQHLRKLFNGETVGRWVLREWGIKVPFERGRSWPNLTVWEGFIESLLHNPATYSTYPAQWHSLLSHLCLSHTLITLHMRSLPKTVFPDVLPEEEPPEPPAPEDLTSMARMSRHERLVELVMPQPLAAKSAVPSERRGSMPAALPSTRRRSNSTAASFTSKPPAAYPQAKRYGFKSGGSSRPSSISSRPGSVFSFQSTPTHIRKSISMRTNTPPIPKPSRIEPIFDNTPPYVSGRAPLLRVFVPLSQKVQRWPSAEGAMWAVRELDKCGATKRLQLGDLVINTAIPNPKSTEHILIFVPFVKHLLVPLEYTLSPTGHLPNYVNAFNVPPLYYHPLLAPLLIYLDLSPFVIQAMSGLRVAFDRRDLTVSSGARVTAKRYITVTGFQIDVGDKVVPEWEGIVTLESEGTAEGKVEMERRLGWGDPIRASRGAWEVVKERSMPGNIWLRLYK